MTAELETSVDVLCLAVHDSALSVRVSAASALANLAEALQQQQQQPNMQLMPSLTKLASGVLYRKDLSPISSWLPACLHMASSHVHKLQRLSFGHLFDHVLSASMSKV